MAYKSLLCLAVTATLTLSVNFAEARKSADSRALPRSTIRHRFYLFRRTHRQRRTRSCTRHDCGASHSPFGTKVRVTNKRNGKTVVVRINDRGPFIRGRVIDVTPAAARALGFSGLTPVVLDIEG